MDLEHAEKLAKVEALAKSNQHRIDEMEKRQDNLDNLVATVAVLAEKESNVENDVKEIKNDVKTLTNKPAKRWETLVSQAISIIVAAIIGFFLAKIGL